LYADLKYKDINQVMKYMNLQIYEGVNFAGETFTKMSPEKFFYTMRTLVKYKDDPINTELLMSPETFVNNNYWGVPFTGDCDDFVIFSTAYFIAYNIPCKIVLAGRTKKAPVHIYNLVLDNKKGKFVPFDLTNPFYNYERDEYKYFQKLKINE